jgi:ribonucleoside-diphosphate reductase alpha chain
MEETDLGGDDANQLQLALAEKFVSRGLTRGVLHHNLVTVHAQSQSDRISVVESGMPVTSGNLAMALHNGGGMVSAQAPSRTKAVKSSPMLRTASDRAAEARVKGYEGESCGSCGNFTLVRNGTCLKCDTCGGTSGCS